MEMSQTTYVSTNTLRNTIRMVIGLATGITGLGDMLSVIVPKLEWMSLLGAWDIDLHNSAHGLTVIVGFFLIVLSSGLMRGKRHAWGIATVLLLTSAFLHILRGGSVLATVIAVVLSVVLLACHKCFRAKSDPPSVWRGYIALVLSLGFVAFYAIGGFIALFDQFEPVVDRIGIDQVILRLLTHTHLHLIPGTQAFFFSRALPCLGMSAVLFAMMQILRPVAATLLPNDKERMAVSSLTRIYGKNSISYFALTDEKSYFFSSSGKSVISYVLEGSVAVVAGDPIGPESEMQTVMKEFIAFCNEQDWTIVFWQVRSELIELYQSYGLKLLKIGEDAVINTQTFTLKGGAMSNVRSSAKRAEKEGLRVIFYRGRVENTEQLAQMEQISRKWLAAKGSSEMGFSMGKFDPHGDERQITALAVDGNNKVHAFVTFVPIYGRNGWGLDLMRRAEECAPGTMELLLARSIEHLKACGADMVSLGLAPLSNQNNDDESFLGASIDFLTHRFGNPAKNQSLCNFKKKFHPTWESRYLVYSSTLKLPKIGWALYRAHQQDCSTLTMLRKSLESWQESRQAKNATKLVPLGSTVTGSL